MRAPRLGAWWVVAVGLLVGLVLVFLGHVRPGGYVASAALILGGLLRLVLPSARAASLTVRSRAVDALMLFGLGAALLVLVAVVDLRPRP